MGRRKCSGNFFNGTGEGGVLFLENGPDRRIGQKAWTPGDLRPKALLGSEPLLRGGWWRTGVAEAPLRLVTELREKLLRDALRG